MFKLAHLLLIITGTTTALMAGLFFAWSFSVTTGIARLPDNGYIASMQAMNRAILNGVFLSCFMGTVLLLPLATWMYYTPQPSPRFWFLLVSTLLYVAGVFGVTMLFNVPMNEKLDKFPLHTASADEMATLRAWFEGRWNRLNMIRTVANTLSIACFIAACLMPNQQQ